MLGWFQQKQLTLKSQKMGKELLELAQEDKKVGKFLQKFSKQELDIVSNPEHYTGLAEKKTEMLCKEWKKELGL